MSSMPLDLQRFQLQDDTSSCHLGSVAFLVVLETYYQCMAMYSLSEENLEDILLVLGDSNTV